MNLEYILDVFSSKFSDNLFSLLYLSFFVSLLLFLVRFIFRKKSEYYSLINAHISIDEIYKNLSHKTPPCSTKGWKCIGMFEGCRLWSINKPKISGISGEFISCMSFITHTPVKDLIDVFLDPREIFEWNFVFGSTPQVTLYLTS